MAADSINRVVPVRVGRVKYEVEVMWAPLGDALRAAIASAIALSAA